MLPCVHAGTAGRSRHGCHMDAMRHDRHGVAARWQAVKVRLPTSFPRSLVHSIPFLALSRPSTPLLAPPRAPPPSSSLASPPLSD